MGADIGFKFMSADWQKPVRLHARRLLDRTGDEFLKPQKLNVTSSRKLGGWILENFVPRLPGISQESYEKNRRKGEFSACARMFS